MKKFLAVVLFAITSLAFAEASFDEIERLINQKNYAAAEAGLEIIIKNHPNSAKAFYAMAQAQAGLGNQEKAQKALNIAKGIDPSLKFVSEGSVRNLEQAISPQTEKLTYEEPSHFWRNFAYFALFSGFAVACYFLYSVYARKRDEEAAEKAAKEAQWAKEMDEAQERHNKLVAERAEARRKEEEAEAALRAHKNYGHERFDPANPDKLKSVKQFKEEQAAAKQAAELREAQARAEAAEAEARRARYATSQPTTTVVNNSSNDMLTGVLIGNMLSGSNHSHDTTVIRETVRETPSRSSSWDDDTPSRSSSRSSSWDDDSSSSRSSSWDSSSSSSSSWDSSSSSSSSWDSGSSDSGSSSSWD